MAKYFDDLKLSFGYHTAGNFPFTYCVKEKDGKDGIYPHDGAGAVTTRVQYDIDAWNEFKNLKVNDRILGCIDTKENELAPFSGNAYTCVSKYRVDGHDHCFCIAHKPDEYVKVVEVPKLGYLKYTGADLIDLGQLCNILRVGVVNLGVVANDEVIDIKNKSGAAVIGGSTVPQMKFTAAADNNVGSYHERNLHYITDKLYIERNGGDVAANTGKAIIYLVYKPQDTVEVLLSSAASNAASGVFVSDEFVEGTAIEVSYTYGGGVTGDAKITVLRLGTAGAVVNAKTLNSAWTIEAGNKAFTGQAIEVQQTDADTSNVHLGVSVKIRFAKS